MTGQAAPLLLVFASLFSHWRRHKLQFLTLLIGLASATALWTAVQALNTHARASYDRSAATVAAFDLPSLVSLDRTPFDQAAFAALRRAGILVTPLVEGRFGSPANGVRLTGVDPLTYSPADGQRDNDAIINPQGDALLRFLEPPGILYADTVTAERLRQVLDGIAVTDRPGIEIRDTLGSGQVIGDIATVQRLLELDGRLTKLLLPQGSKVDSKYLPAPWSHQLIVTEPAVEVDLAGLTDSFHLNLTAFGLLCFLVGLFIVYSAIGLAIEDRLHAFRTLRICGVSRRLLLALLISEMMGIAALAGALGVIGGYTIAAFLLPDVAASLRGLYGAQVAGSLRLDLGWWLGGIAVSLIGALGAALGAFFKVSKMSLLEARGTAAWHHKQTRIVYFQALFGTFFVILAFFLYQFAGGLLASFMVMAGILLGAAFLLPGILLVLLTIGRHTATAPLAQWFWADSRQQLSGLSLALMALLLALGTNVGVNGMVEGFRLTFDAFLEERLSADIYVLGSSNEEAQTLMAWATQQPDIKAVLPIWGATTQLYGLPVGVTGFTDHPTYRDTWTLLQQTDTPWSDTVVRDGVLINEQLHYRANLEIGDVVEVPTDSAPLRRIVAGIYSDYGNPRAEIRLPNSVLEQYWPSAERRRVSLLTTGNVANLADRITQDVGIPADQMINQTGLKGFSRSVFNKTFVISGALGTLTLGVAGIAMITSLLTLSGARLTGVAPLWAMGVRRRTITRLEGSKILLLALLTSLAAIPLGIAISWCLVAVINVAAFGWRLPLYLFPMQWLQLGALGVFTAFIAALYPLVRLQRTPPAALSKVFAHEH